jgi:uncharacterized protein (UPF0216 family)
MDLEEFRKKIITVRGQQVILDSDVADMCQVENKRINRAVKNNPDKFPEDCIITLTDDEIEGLRSKFPTTKFNKTVHAFSERGLHVLATILKLPLATEMTITIIKEQNKQLWKQEV